MYGLYVYKLYKKYKIIYKMYSDNYFWNISLKNVLIDRIILTKYRLKYLEIEK